MKEAVADTSALVSLALSGKMELILRHVKISVPPTIKAKLEEMPRFPDEEGTAAKKALSMIESGKISLQKIAKSEEAEKLVTKNIDLGEAECFQLATERKMPAILMDDLAASYGLSEKAWKNGIRMRISAAAITELLAAGEISKGAARKALNKMIKNRKWEKTTMEYLIKKHLEEK